MTSAVRVSRGLYKILLLAYPPDFRLRFGSEMATTFSDQICGGEWEHSRLPGVARVWRCALREVLSVAVPLHLQNSIVIATSLARLSSLALFITVFHAMTHVCNGE
jgi:hypothetical protein